MIRRFGGYERFAGLIAGQALARLFTLVGLYTNYFQPSCKLIAREKIGSRTRKRYDRPQTPCQRLLAHPAVTEDAKAGLRATSSNLDPLLLLNQIRQAQSALAALAAPHESSQVQKEDLAQFLARLSHLWREGEVNPARRAKQKRPRWWRTHPDPLESVWPQVLSYLQDHPDASGTQILKVLLREHPGSVGPRQLRTLQRRLKQWRSVMARELVYGVLNGPDESGSGTEIVREIAPVGVK